MDAVRTTKFAGKRNLFTIDRTRVLSIPRCKLPRFIEKLKLLSYNFVNKPGGFRIAYENIQQKVS